MIDFLVIGASRSGTTWTHDNLLTHPEIFLPTKVGEPHFFSKYYDKGLDYYHSLFSEANPNQTVGEVTPDYIYSEHAPERIYKYNPNVKLILIVRNPVERLYSMFWTLKGKYPENKNITFEEKIKSHKGLIKQGFYMNYIENYLKLFNQDNLLILQFDELKSNPEEFLKKAYRHIGVDANHISPYLNHKINRASFRKHYSKSQTLYLIWRISRKLNLNKLTYKIEKVNSKEIPSMNPKTKSELIDVYKSYNKKLERFLNVDLSHWSN